MKAMCVTLFVCALAFAQETHQVEGEVVSLGAQAPLWAELTSLTGTVVSKVAVNPDGRFVLFGVPDGAYVLRIVDGARMIVSSQPVTLRQADQSVRFSTPDSAAPGERMAGSKVSVAALRHKPRKQALRIAGQAQKLAMRGDHQAAVAALQKAVALDPQFVDARGNLGAEYMAMHRYAEGAAETRQAVSLDPSAAWLQSNLAFALYELGEVDEALHWARGAVALDSRNAKSRYFLGWLLLRQPGGAAEGLLQLERAAPGFPQAYRTLADYHRATGDLERANNDMQQYLAADPAGHHAEVEAWKASLR